MAMTSSCRQSSGISRVGDAAEQPERDGIDREAIADSDEGVAEFVEDDAGEQAEGRTDAEYPDERAVGEDGHVQASVQRPVQQLGRLFDLCPDNPGEQR